MPTLKIAGNDCFYTYEDLGHDDTIVFSNSLGTDLTMWDKVVHNLRKHLNILRYDTRGHGQSSINSDTVTIAALGEDVIGLLDHLKLGKVYFCGLSMGGLIGQWLGIHHPERFIKNIIANTAAKIGTVDGWNARIAQVKEHGLGSILDGTAQRWFTPAFRQEHPEAVRDVLEKFTQTSLQGYIACCAAVRDADFRKELSNLKVPTLVISGTQDEVTTTVDGEFLASGIPRSRHVQLEANHLSSVELPTEFATNVLYAAKNEGDFYLEIYH
ncbi:3-oxoadipate enol-lactonase [Pontibacter sp. HSC-36F09]|uniref:3-oxoadipate enol-lactonase n=1 Tax=Pontibacter sp. HSC-36F09 TaxID=2910966 RepID=UPI00209FF834|nr:3-oxoadipate enol-lactonase [Pontibacter sp. HSC-36F09]MCP2045305.1 3-oxoadipate enol-lactonase [Pontibacter sp. HSC-36F09]